MNPHPTIPRNRCVALPSRARQSGSIGVLAALAVLGLVRPPAAGADLQLQTLIEFQANPKNPRAELVRGSDGNFYGTTMFGGTNGENGTVFRLTPSGSVTLLHSFAGTDGALPSAGLVPVGNGFLYGTTTGGGSNGGFGVVFRIATNGDFAVLHSFNGSDGSAPSATLAQWSDGNFYGTTASGGAEAGDHGTVFRITPDGLLTSLFSFNGTNGSRPMCRLVQGDDGAFYGTTSEGGPGYDGGGLGGDGTIFRITTSGVFNSLFSFHGTDGSDPESGLARGADGHFYGTTQSGGTNADNGTVFRITSAGLLTVLHSFGGSDGSYPLGGLAPGSDGNFYGATAGDNATDFGTLFRITPAGGLTTLFTFNSTRGASPAATLMLAGDGNLYGTTFEGGAGGGGTVFRLVEPVALGSVAASPGSVKLTWTSFSNGVYRVEQASDLTAVVWNTLADGLVALGGTTSLTNLVGNAGQGFYRVRLLP